MTELKPMHDRQKSFWKRAYVDRTPATGCVTLLSYDTPVCFVDAAGSFHRIWGGWSRTTSKHVMEFWRQYCGKDPPPFKKVWDSMPLENVPAVGREVAKALLDPRAVP